MDIKIYTSPTCHYCLRLKELFERANISEYQEVVCQEDEQHQKFREEYPNASSFPYVVIDGDEIGGLVETAKFLLDKNLVSTNKKNEGS